jgi:hypothetical protein
MTCGLGLGLIGAAVVMLLIWEFSLKPSSRSTRVTLDPDLHLTLVCSLNR